MKNLTVVSLLIFLLIQSIASATEYEIKSNYEIIEIRPGINYFVYLFPTFSSSSLYTSPYIMLKFLENVEMKINFYNIKESFEYILRDGFISVPVKFIKYIQELELEIQNYSNKSVKMIFIDTTLEINASFDEFLNWKYELKYIETYNFPEPNLPEPIIFNVEKIEKTGFYVFDTTTEGTVVAVNDTDTNLLYYCINSENGCKFEVLNTLAVYQGNKYKFKLNPCLYRYNYYFFFPPIKYIDIESSELLETMDLTKNKYYNLKPEYVNEEHRPKYYKVENLAEDKFVLFNYESDTKSSFKICNINKNECSEVDYLYKFLKNNEYIIFINYMDRYYYNDYVNSNDQNNVEQSGEEYEEEGQEEEAKEDEKEKDKENKEEYNEKGKGRYIFPKYMIIPVNENVIETKTEGYFTFSDTKILVVNLENKDKLYAMGFITNKIIYSYTDNIVTKDNLDTLKFKKKIICLWKFQILKKISILSLFQWV